MTPPPEFAGAISSVDRGVSRDHSHYKPRYSTKPKKQNGDKNCHCWRGAISAYKGEERSVLIFADIAESNKAIRFCWNEPRLRGMPFDIGAKGLIVPTESVEIFRDSGIEFESQIHSRH